MLPTNKLINLLEHAISLLIVFLLLAGTVVWTGQLLGMEIGTGPQSAHLTDRSLLPDKETISRLDCLKTSVCNPTTRPRGW